MGDKPAANLMPAMYSHRLPDIQQAARECGYAVSIHGSMQRDLDVIAVPWTDNACSARELVKYLCHVLHCDLTPDSPARKPHGRLAYTLLMGGACFMDLSVTPAGGWAAAELEQCRDQLEQSQFRGLDDFQKTQGQWAAATFGDQTAEEKLRHCIKEVGEVIDAQDDVTEYADVLSLLVDAARLRGISAGRILDAAWRKLEYNRLREWKKNSDGTFSGSKPLINNQPTKGISPMPIIQLNLRVDDPLEWLEENGERLFHFTWNELPEKEMPVHIVDSAVKSQSYDLFIACNQAACDTLQASVKGGQFSRWFRVPKHLLFDYTTLPYEHRSESIPATEDD